MQVEFEYTAGGTTYAGVAETADRTWGKGVRLKIFDAQGEIRDRARFACHPEFADFDALQGKPSEELAKMAIDLLKSGIYEERSKSARSQGLELFIRLNDHVSEP